MFVCRANKKYGSLINSVVSILIRACPLLISRGSGYPPDSIGILHSAITTLRSNNTFYPSRKKDKRTDEKRIREEEENNLPQMKSLFFLYVWLNLTRIHTVFKENLVKHTRKETIQTGRLFFLFPYHYICLFFNKGRKNLPSWVDYFVLSERK